jgi:prepilin signal peptidase PulO-like enzyme (type II secretory pathway)
MQALIFMTFIMVSATDIRDRSIPKRIVFLNYFVGFLIDPVATFQSFLIWILYITLAKFALEIRKSSAIGYGDIRLAGLTACSAHGLEGAISTNVFAWLFASFFVAYFYIGKRHLRHKSFPFAPFLALGYLLS